MRGWVRRRGAGPWPAHVGYGREGREAGWARGEAGGEGRVGLGRGRWPVEAFLLFFSIFRVFSLEFPLGLLIKGKRGIFLGDFHGRESRVLLEIALGSFG